MTLCIPYYVPTEFDLRKSGRICVLSTSAFKKLTARFSDNEGLYEDYLTDSSSDCTAYQEEQNPFSSKT